MVSHKGLSIKNVAVIGAGVMGAAIAAHCANAGCHVFLYDLPHKEADPKDWSKRNEKVLKAKEHLKKVKPSPLMHESVLDKIEVCNLKDDLDRLKECHWVVEAIIEDVTIKTSLYKDIAPYCKKAIISSNTSTIPLKNLVADMPSDMKERFFISHFFNPPRYMRLLEVVGHDDLQAGILKSFTAFAEKNLGKSVIQCLDTPGFIANRIGIFWMASAVHHALEMGLSVEEADAVLGRPLFIPKTGVFGLLDMVGIDLMPHILKSMKALLPQEDRLHAVTSDLSFITRMVDDGFIGRKGKGGFYRLNENKEKEALDLNNYTYKKSYKPRLSCVKKSKKDLIALFKGGEKASHYARRVMLETFCYAVHTLKEVGGDVVPVDQAMRLGFNWKYGPFELMDKIGLVPLLAMLKKDGISEETRALFKGAYNGFYHKEKAYHALNGYQKEVVKPHVLLLRDIKKRTKPLMSNKSASVWDIGDGVLCFEIHSTMNTMNPLVLWLLSRALKRAEKSYKALVIYNEGEHFSAGANIALLLGALKLFLYPLVSFFVWQGQRTYRKIQKSRIPVVAAPSGLCLGGGCEIIMHCHSVEAHSESYMGLVEVGVGVIPGWGGCKELLLRATEKQTFQRTFAIPAPKEHDTPQGPIATLRHVFETIATAKVSTSAMEAKDLYFLHEKDGITMNRDHLLYNAKQRALSLVSYGKDGRVKRRSTRIRRSYVALSGETGFVALEMVVRDLKRAGKILPHDEVVSLHLARVLTGNKKDYLEKTKVKEILKSEKEQFIKLTRMKKTQERIAHMLKKGKPLRN